MITSKKNKNGVDDRRGQPGQDPSLVKVLGAQLREQVKKRELTISEMAKRHQHEPNMTIDNLDLKEKESLV